MVALTYGDARVATPDTAAATRVAAAPQKSWFSRFIAAMAEARMRQAERELRLYGNALLPAQDELPFDLSKTGTPRGGW